MTDWSIMEKFLVNYRYTEDRYPNGISKRLTMKDRSMQEVLEDCNLSCTSYARLKKQLFENKPTRRLNSWLGLELKGNRIEINRYGTPIASVYPTWSGGMVIEFIASVSDVCYHSQGLVTAFSRWLPFNFLRHSKGVYKVDHTYNLGCRTHNKIDEMLKLSKEEVSRLGYDCKMHWEIWDSVQRAYSPTYFQGIKFDIDTGQCLNPRVEQEFKEIPEKRKQWRTSLAKYKKGLKVRLKVGSLQKYFDVLRNMEWSKKYVDIANNTVWVKLMATCLEKQVYPKEILLGIVSYLDTSTSDKGIDTLFRSMSRNLRIELGVFGDVKDVDITNDNFNITPEQLVKHYEEEK